uniref:Uncharacterized protein n=1 Tax=Triticum urartu TaxID=4572 RepID=A0A8R7U373_TRIUA
MVVSAPAGSQNEEPLNLGSENQVANEVIDLEGENQDKIVDEPARKKPKKISHLNVGTILIKLTRRW